MIRQVYRRLHHASCVARGAHAPTLAGEGDEVVVPAVLTSGAGKAVGKDTALQIFAKRLADKGLWGVVVALAVELAGTGQIKPGLKMLGYRLVQQRAFGVARIVEFVLGTRWPVRMRMRLRWVCGGGHGAVPAWTRCLMTLGLYPALWISLLSGMSHVLAASYVKQADRDNVGSTLITEWKPPINSVGK
jgi:hypothetical protein